jgi:hypothetical protein
MNADEMRKEKTENRKEWTGSAWRAGYFLFSHFYFLRFTLHRRFSALNCGFESFSLFCA